MRSAAALLVAAAALLLPCTRADLAAQLRLADAGDRQALRSWFVLLADAAFYEPPAEVTDCAALVRYALRESLRPHTPEWLRRAGLPAAPGLPDVRERPSGRDGLLPIFRVSARPDDLAEFADARTIVRWNAWQVSRDVSVARPGDLLYFRQPSQRQPDHLMIVVGASRFDRAAPDFVVYHTGPDGDDPGEIRKVRLADLLRHPAPRWRPVPSNEAFVGVFRLTSFP
ncbi:MAG TPA: DUF1175 family protein [Vicinamibacterales bacterium]